MTEKQYLRGNDFARSLADEIHWSSMRCKRCGAKLPKYPQYTDSGEYKICKKCGYSHLIVRRIPKNLRKSERSLSCYNRQIQIGGIQRQILSLQQSHRE